MRGKRLQSVIRNTTLSTMGALILPGVLCELLTGCPSFLLISESRLIRVSPAGHGGQISPGRYYA